MKIFHLISTRVNLVIAYALLGFLWIAFSDAILLSFINDPKVLSEYQSYKGWFYIALTTGLLFVLLRWFESHIESNYKKSLQLEKKFKLLFEDAPNPYQSLAPDGKILAVNKKWLETLGYQKEDEVIGHWFGEMLAPEYVEHFKKNFPKFKEQGSIRGVEFMMLHKDGIHVPVLFHGQISYDENHSMLQTHCAFEDVSSKHKIEHLNKVLTIIRDVNQSIVRLKTPEDLIQESCNILSSSNLYDHVWINWIHDGVPELFSSIREGDRIEAFKAKIVQGWVPPCIDSVKSSSKAYAFIKDIKNSCDECNLVSNGTGQNAYILKLEYENTVHGYLSVATKHQFNEEERDLLEEVSGDIAYGLYNIAREQLLIKNEALYDHTINSVESMIFVKDMNLNYITCNTAMEKLLGLTKDEIIGKNDYDLFPKEIAKTCINNDEQILLTKHSRSNYEWVSFPDGQKAYLLTLKSPLIGSNGEVIGLVGSSVDMTEQNHLYEILQDAQKQAKIGSWEQTFDDEVLHWSDEVFRIFEHDPQENMTFEEFIERVHPDDRKNLAETFQKSVAQQELYYLEHRLLFSDGRIKYLLERAEHFFNEDNKHVRTMGTVQDITTLKNVEYQLEERNRQFISIMETLPGMAYRCNNDKFWTMHFISDGCFNLTGYSISDLIENKRVAYGEIIHPDDQKMVWEQLQVQLSEKGPFELEYRIVMQDGQEKWVWEAGNGVYDTHGDLKFIEGIILDSTKRREAEVEATKRDAMLTSVFQVIPDLLFIMESDGKIIDYRAKMDSHLYVNPDVFLGHHMQNVLPKEVGELFARSIKSISKEKALNIFEYELEVENDKRYYEARMAELPVDGHIMTIVRDITDLRNKEDMLMVQSRHAAMGEMIAMIAHQWRQPISVIAMDVNNMLIDIGLNDFNETDAKEYANDILSKTQYLSETIDDFRNFFKPDKSLSRVKVQDVLKETEVMISQSLKNNNIALKKNYKSDSEIDVYPKELKQVFINIINNAKDSLLMEKKHPLWLEITLYENNDNVIIEFSDNGSGIKSKNMTKIFDPYFSTKDEKTGTGLGLYMSKMIIEDHLKGILEAYNTDTGACFKVVLKK